MNGDQSKQKCPKETGKGNTLFIDVRDKFGNAQFVNGIKTRSRKTPSSKMGNISKYDIFYTHFKNGDSGLLESGWKKLGVNNTYVGNFLNMII